ncbi:MAG: sugar phosphate isomerase/epimerase [Candidatus Latescibacteria bacterium]|jgi:sugar phosphate isomerase/epimerase|nr:sugar phosphate isomerase/epimerase [Candidatus Latescibacterota bacterium]
MPAPVALQLYSVREAAEKDFEGVVRRVADLGYAGVEPAGFPGSSPEAAGKLFQSLGLDVPSAHLSLPIGENKQLAIESAQALGTKRLIAGFGPDDMNTADKVKASCEKFNEASVSAGEHGFTFGIHNHWWEFLKVDGEHVYEIMLRHLEPAVFFELDVYWVQTGGPDPAAVVKQLGNRAPILHIKDGPCTRDGDMTAVGEGVVDIPAVIDAGAAHTEWHIVELDRCATDMFEAVEKSLNYLVSNGLGTGKDR